MANQFLTPYLLFGGRAEEAIDYYVQALGADCVSKIRYSESPEPVPEGMVAPGYQNKIMHSALQFGSTTLYMSDGSGSERCFEGYMMQITVESADEVHTKFNRLVADGGQAMMPPSQTFWSPCFCMVTDKFGVIWMFTIPGDMM